MTTVIGGDDFDALDEMLTEMLLDDNLGIMKVPVGSSLVYNGSAGRIWCTPDAQYLIELAGKGGSCPSDPDEPQPPDHPDNPYDWPPPKTPDDPNPNQDPMCKKTINLIYGAEMSRVERIQGFDTFIMPDIDKWPQGIDPFCEPNLPLASLAAGGTHPSVFVEEEVIIAGDRPAMPELTTTVTYYHSQINDDDFTRIPLAGLNTAFVGRTLLEADVAKESNLNLIVTPPPNFTIYRLSNGDVVGQFDKAWSGEVTLELRNAAPPKGAGCANPNFNYATAFLSEATTSSILYKKHNGIDAIFCNMETFSGKERKSEKMTRTLKGAIPTMDANCYSAAETILYQVLFANALKAKEFLQKNDDTFGGLTCEREKVLMHAQFDMFKQFLLDASFSVSNAKDLVAIMKKDLKIGPFAQAFQLWCSQWACRKPAMGAIQAAQDSAGACDHRARVGVLVFNLIGIPARRIHNSCHAYIEYFSPGQGIWIDLDLGGCNPGGGQCPSPSPPADPNTPQSLEEEEEQEDKDKDDNGEDDDNEDDDSGGGGEFDFNDPEVVRAILMNEFKYSESDASKGADALMDSDIFR